MIFSTSLIKHESPLIFFASLDALSRVLLAIVDFFGEYFAKYFALNSFISPAPMNKILRPLMAPKIFVISLTAADAIVVELVPIWVFERIIFDNSNTLLKKGIKLLSSKLPFSEIR